MRPSSNVLIVLFGSQIDGSGVHWRTGDRACGQFKDMVKEDRDALSRFAPSSPPRRLS